MKHSSILLYFYDKVYMYWYCLFQYSYSKDEAQSTRPAMLYIRTEVTARVR